MKNNLDFGKLGRKVAVRDIRCSECIYGGRKGVWCVRLNSRVERARKSCVKSRWYAQMCTISSAVDKELTLYEQ